MAEEWVAGLQRGEAAAFDAVYAEYHKRLYNFLYRLCGQRDLAEDLFQETWMKLARNATRLEASTDLGAWLFTVARNAFFSHRRWVVMDQDRIRQLRPPATATPEELSGARHALWALERALATLPLKHREVLLLVGVEGMEHERAAAVLGLSDENLRQRLSRARAALAEAMEAEPKRRAK